MTPIDKIVSKGSITNVKAIAVKTVELKVSIIDMASKRMIIRKTNPSNLLKS